jgi:hypothetical protein
MADFNSLAVIHDSLLETYFTVLFWAETLSLLTWLLLWNKNRSCLVI